MSTLQSSTPRLITTSDPAEFMRECGSYLAACEAENNTILGIASVLGTPSSPYKDFYLAYFKDNNQLEGAFMMTPPHQLGLSYPCSHRAVDAVIDDLVASSHTVPGVVGHTDSARLFIASWKRKEMGTAEIATHLLLYKLSAVKDFEASSGQWRQATVDDLELVFDWARAFARDAHLPQGPENELVRQNLTIGVTEGRFFFWVDQQPVSMVRASGTTPTGIRISHVYTPPHLRRKGYASSLVGKVSEHLLNSGRKFCFLFTDAQNPTSNKIYQNLGYEKVCEFLSYNLHPPN